MQARIIYFRESSIEVDLRKVSTVTVDRLVYSLLSFTCKTYDCDGYEYTPRTLKSKYILLTEKYLKSLGIVHNFLELHHLVKLHFNVQKRK